MDDLPVATLRPTGTGTPTPIAIYYVHADQLGTPRAITRPSDDAIVWKWDNAEPFGNNAANDNPSGLGTFSFNLRFPGQYYDVETGLHYNYFRDYDPTIGRYVESDPIGLEGGTNTYAYVDANPASRIDPSGTQYMRECGRCKVWYDSDQRKGAHTHWECPGQPRGCIKKDGKLCDGSAPPPPEVMECLRKWKRVPPAPTCDACQTKSSFPTAGQIGLGAAIACGVVACALQPEICLPLLGIGIGGGMAAQ